MCFEHLIGAWAERQILETILNVGVLQRWTVLLLVLRVVLRDDRGCRALEERDAGSIQVFVRLESGGTFCASERRDLLVPCRKRRRQLLGATHLLHACVAVLSLGQLGERPVAGLLEEGRRSHILIIFDLDPLQSWDASAGRFRVQIVLNDSLPALLVLAEFDRAQRRLRQVRVEFVERAPVLRLLLEANDVGRIRLLLLFLGILAVSILLVIIFVLVH